VSHGLDLHLTAEQRGQTRHARGARCWLWLSARPAHSSPLGRLLDPGEVADAIVYLGSPAAASINGQALVIDGGGIQA
jgi:NAD(P)-dependent dehydrogenase (short-subunit alcohol dehydrogenase family)